MASNPSMKSLSSVVSSSAEHLLGGPTIGERQKETAKVQRGEPARRIEWVW